MGRTYTPFVCRVCGGQTTTNGFGRRSHEKSKQHMGALHAKLAQAEEDLERLGRTSDRFRAVESLKRSIQNLT